MKHISSRAQRGWSMLGALVAGLLVAVVPASAQDDWQIYRLRTAIERFEFDDAKTQLARLDPSHLRVRLERARLAIHEDRCDEAVAELVTLQETDFAGPAGAADAGASDVDAGAGLDDETVTMTPLQQAAMLFEIARSCARVTAGTLLVTDEERGIEVRFQDEHDRALFEPLADALDRQRRVLEVDLGVTLPPPIRVLFVRDQLSLSITTGLPYEAATKTGTLGVAKWGRITMVTPRATRGYEWLDTAAHELTHIAITRGTADRAPLWLQEGLAKREEQRWREPTARDAKISAESLTLWGIERKLDLPLDQLGPSLAMLPSAQQAMVVYAEVQSFVNYLVQEGGPELLPKLLAALEQSGSVDKALEMASGQNLSTWEAAFRKALAQQPRKPLPPMFDSAKRDTKKLRELSERVRLAELLLARGHAGEALDQLSKVEEQGALDPRFRFVRGKALQAQGHSADAYAALGDPDEFWANFGPYWALRAQLETDALLSQTAQQEALRADPLGPETACELIGGELCEAAKASKVPALGRD